MDGWMDTQQMDGWMDSKKKLKKNRWMVGWLENIYGRLDGQKKMDGKMHVYKYIYIYIIDGWLDGYKLIFENNRRMVGRITKIDGWKDGYKNI